MPVHARQQPPVGHGEVLCSPPFGEWASLAAANVEARARWPLELAELHALGRAETLEAAQTYSAALGLPSEARGGLLIMTGHQPELFHPGVWVKDFLVQRFADEHGATGLDLVVDTDAAGHVTMKTPCLTPEVRICEVPVAEGTREAAYVQVAPPDDDARGRLRSRGLESLKTLPAPALGRHFESFCDALDAAAGATSDLASCMTLARRLYERPAGTDYLEVPVSRQSSTWAYRRFAASLLLDAQRFRSEMNSALGEYRRRTNTRSQAQPFPDLGGRDDRVDAPFWLLEGNTRRTVSVGAGGRLYAGEDLVAELGHDTDVAAERLAEHDIALAPKALALTLFQRLFVSDLFVHGTGGGRYDRVTDEVIRRYFGIEPPAFAIASMTMLLPLGARLASTEDVAALEQRIHRFTHNPDQVLGEVEFDTVAECLRAEELASRKRELVGAIAAPEADRKALGAQIRSANEELSELLGPMVAELTSTLERFKAERDAADVLTDRTYPYCLWDPREVMDKVR